MIKIVNGYILFGAPSSVFVFHFLPLANFSPKSVMCKSVTSLNFNFRAVLVVAFLTLVLQNHMGESQTCPLSLSNLQQCFPYVNPGAPPPSPGCGRDEIPVITKTIPPFISLFCRLTSRCGFCISVISHCTRLFTFLSTKSCFAAIEAYIYIGTNS